MAYESPASILGGSQYPPKRRRRPPSPPVTTVSAETGAGSYPTSTSSSPTTVTAATGSSSYVPNIPSTVPPDQNTEPLRALLAGEPVGGGQTLERLLQAGGKRRERGQGTVGVPEIVPPQFRKAVAKHGQRLNQPLAEAGVNMTGPEYLARLIQFESGWSPTAENPSSAFGFGQFIDSTAQDFRQRLGIETQDPRRPTQMIKGASVHAGGKAGYGALYAGYNPGYSSTDPIPGVPAGKNVPVKISRKAAKRVGEGDIATGSTDGRSLSIAELYHDPGVNISDGQQSGAIGGHGSHVHFASESARDVLRAAAIAQRRGLEVRENPLFDPVDPVHAEGSHHDQASTLPQGLRQKARRLGGTGTEIGEAIDVSGGTPEDLLAYNRRLAQLGGGPVLPDGGTLSSGYGGPADTTTAATTAGVGMATGDRFGAAAEQRTAAAISPMQNALSARPALPTPFGAPTGVDEDDPLSALLRPDPQTSDEDDLVQILERFRPKRRLG